jgi:SAM-dependent methyltransferase
MRFRNTRAYRLYRDSATYTRVRRKGKAIKRALKLPGYLGSTHECPVCGTRLRAFKPIWKSYWRDVEIFAPLHGKKEMETFNTAAYSCPRCDASDRERLIAIYLDRAFAKFSRTRRYRLIEVAPADGLPRIFARYPFIEYRSADLNRKDVDEHLDLTAMIAHADQSVDILLCSHVLEHVDDDRKAMREIRRVLKPDGFAILLVPLVIGVEETHEDPTFDTLELRWKYFGMGDHVRQYGKRDFIARLEAAGLSVEQLGIDYFGGETFRRAGIADNSILYVVRPRAE